MPVPRHTAVPSASRRGPGFARLLRALALAPVLLPAPPGMSQPADQPADGLDGRDFGAVNLPAAPQEYDLQFSARRAWGWKERQTDRLYLDRDVRVRIGPHQFDADRATIWLEPVLIGGQEGDQVAMYFENVRASARAVSTLGGEIGSGSSMASSSDRLLVTAVVFGSRTRLRTDLFQEGRPDVRFIRDGEERLVGLLREVSAERAAAEPEVSGAEGAETPAPDDEGKEGAGTEENPEEEDEPAPAPGGAERVRTAPVSVERQDSESGEPQQGAPVGQGVIYFSGAETQLVSQPQGGDRAVVLTGGVVVQYQGAPGEDSVQFSAERAVVFLGGDARAGRFRYAASDVQGIFFEGDVRATNGDYNLRGSRVYYDVPSNRAMVLDAVFWTFDEERGMPLYVRAAALRQESDRQWSGEDVTLANVAFAEPHFSIGATSVTITREQSENELPKTLVDARSVSFQAGSVSLLTLPRMSGEVKPTPLRRVTVESDAGDAIIRTTWDLYTLLGLEPSPGHRADLLLDGYFDRGPGVGADVAWREEGIDGTLLGYYVYDNGTDHLSSGDTIDYDGESRGIVIADQILRIDENWSVFAEASYISDPAFTDAFFEALAETRREFVSSVYARYRDDKSLFSAEVRGTFNDFIANEYLLQSLGYSTERLPEATYSRFADELFGGLISYSNETRIGLVELAFAENTPAEQGFNTPTRSFAAVDLPPNVSIGDSLRAEGLTEDAVFRFDTRHEIEMPLSAGALNIVPFATGRITVWDNNFESYNGDPDADSYRFWGAVGARVSTSIVKIDDTVESDLFDVHRIRHIIEPSVTAWHADSSLSSEDLPIYDADVESLDEGTLVRAGVRSTWQTMRGPERRRRSVDLLEINVDYVWSSEDESEFDSPYGRFIEARPEQSNVGRFIDAQGTWNVTNSVALLGEMLFDTDDAEIRRTVAGALLDHGYGFSSIFEYRKLEEPESEFFTAGARYELTRKYAVTLAAVFDLDSHDLQSLGATIRRRFPQWTVDVSLDIDEVADDVSVGVSLRPAGFAGESRSRVFTRDEEALFERRTGAATRGRVDYGPFADEP